MRAMQMASDMPNGFDKVLIDTVVQKSVFVLTNVLYALERGDSREQILECLVVS